MLTAGLHLQRHNVFTTGPAPLLFHGNPPSTAAGFQNIVMRYSGKEKRQSPMTTITAIMKTFSPNMFFTSTFRHASSGLVS